MKIVKENLLRLGLSDFSVSEINLDERGKSITFKTVGALYKQSSEIIELGPGFITINNFINMSITAYNAIEDEKKILEENQIMNLREICEVEINDQEVIIKGFNPKGPEWVEYHIEGGEVIGDFADC